ncbi:hypothetical protein MIND_01315500 [Mycena indigotica]|uniref:Suppressor of white apricot N-terminal domain-containing protein n=1 Tax=Mycena indigotica TaxID=2126181 RepID=A0A8H6VUN8_9AGAR|nr:uncharacterized protein MIND_01315500 [Mycena indigotica]KAF7290748.1 hypothetical protein MIND_01315500 [Mycena indigotica]
MPLSRKRKERQSKVSLDMQGADLELPTPNPVLFIQAYEAEVRRGPQARSAAESLELATHRNGKSGLIEWKTPSSDESIWVDRYDARLLLDSLPKVKQQQPPLPASPSGWSDLPSDSEDTFFLSPDEADDYHRDKRRKIMEKTREERLKARSIEDGVPEEDVWGGSDEEPDDPQRQLMERTAKNMMAADNPTQLEMRILANYGADGRFAFLRGRWKRAWASAKHDAKLEQENAKAKEASGIGLGTLADYGDSSAEEDADDANAALVARQARAKAWAQSRKADKQAS